MSPGIDKLQPLQMSQIVLKGSMSGRILQTRPDGSKSHGSLPSQEEKDLPLPEAQVMGHPKGRYIADRQEPDSHR